MRTSGAENDKDSQSRSLLWQLSVLWNIQPSWVLVYSILRNKINTLFQTVVMRPNNVILLLCYYWNSIEVRKVLRQSKTIYWFFLFEELTLWLPADRIFGRYEKTINDVFYFMMHFFMTSLVLLPPLVWQPKGLKVKPNGIEWRPRLSVDKTFRFKV